MNIVYRAEKNNPADAPSHHSNYKNEWELTALLQCLLRAVMQYSCADSCTPQQSPIRTPYHDVHPDMLRSLIVKGLKEDARTKEARVALGLLGKGGPEHRV